MKRKSAQRIAKHGQGIPKKPNEEWHLGTYPIDHPAEEYVRWCIGNRVQPYNEPHHAHAGTKLGGIKSYYRDEQVRIKEADKGDEQVNSKGTSRPEYARPGHSIWLQKDSAKYGEVLPQKEL